MRSRGRFAAAFGIKMVNFSKICASRRTRSACVIIRNRNAQGKSNGPAGESSSNTASVGRMLRQARRKAPESGAARPRTEWREHLHVFVAASPRARDARSIAIFEKVLSIDARRRFLVESLPLFLQESITSAGSRDFSARDASPANSLSILWDGHMRQFKNECASQMREAS